MTRPDEHLDWLYGRQRLGVTLGLDRTKALLMASGNPNDSFSSILVGGTNGKGSTARILSECLSAQGVRTGLYTSPHLSRIGERFVVEGREAEREQVATIVGRLREEAERQEASFFEILTAAACLLFSEAGVETAVMEVGLGGRFDATNALDPELSIVTGVALDHTDLLGGTVEQIAREKSGILRGERLALTGVNGEALEVVRREAANRGTQLWVLGEEIRAEGEQLGWEGQRIGVSCPAGEATGTSPLVGVHQQGNLALAAAAALHLSASPEAVAAGLAKARWPGRMERREWRGRWIVLDGAHNAQAAAALGRALGDLQAEPYMLVVGMGRDKDLASLARALAPGAARTFATRARYSPRARDPHEVAAAFGRGATAVAEPAEALERAWSAAGAGGTIVIAGSLYLVGELRPLVAGETFEAVERWQ